MTKEYTEILTEVAEILKHMETKDIIKLPMKLIEFIEQNKSLDYNFVIEKNKPFSEQKIKRETLAFLGVLVLNYWSESDESKKEFYNMLKENEKKYQHELEEKYNLDNIFNDNNKLETIEDIREKEVSIVEYNEKNLIQKLYSKIKEFLKRK